MQADQHLCCSLHSRYNISSFYIRNGKSLACVCSLAGQFECDLLRNSENRFFSRRSSKMIISNDIKIFHLQKSKTFNHSHDEKNPDASAESFNNTEASYPFALSSQRNQQPKDTTNLKSHLGLHSLSSIDYECKLLSWF